MSKKLMRKKLALMLANLKKKRKYYCEVEYLEATGTQYINTGLLSTENSNVDVVFGFTSVESGSANSYAIFGGRSNSNYIINTFTLFKIASAMPQFLRFDYNGQVNVGNSDNLTFDTTSKYRFIYDGYVGKIENITTGESKSSNISPASTFTTTPICLFCVNTLGTANLFMKGRIYKYWYTDGTNTINLIPVLDWNMRPAMYDKVSGRLFYNQGTGEFSYGREIHYVDYIQSTGTEYIDTGVVPSTTQKLEAISKGFSTNTSSSCVINSGTGTTSNDRVQIWQIYNSINNQTFSARIANFFYNSNISIFDYHKTTLDIKNKEFN